MAQASYKSRSKSRKQKTAVAPMRQGKNTNPKKKSGKTQGAWDMTPQEALQVDFVDSEI